MTNVSYERGIIVLSFLDSSFVILCFVFQIFEIKSGFPIFYSHCIGLYMPACPRLNAHLFNKMSFSRASFPFLVRTPESRQAYSSHSLYWGGGGHS